MTPELKVLVALCLEELTNKIDELKKTATVALEEQARTEPADEGSDVIQAMTSLREFTDGLEYIIFDFREKEQI